MKSLAERCRESFAPDVRDGGEGYFRLNRVRIKRIDSRELSAVVEGKGGDYDVGLNWELADGHRSLLMRCDCPDFVDHGVCKHTWAVLLKLDTGELPKGLQGEASLEVGTPGLKKSDEESRTKFYDRPVVMPPAPFSTGRGRKTPVKVAAEPTEAWRKQLALLDTEIPLRFALHDGPATDTALKEQLTYFVIDVGRSQAAGAIVLCAFARRRHKTGEFGAPKRARIAGQNADRTSNDDDRRLLRLLQLSGNRDLLFTSVGYFDHQLYCALDAAAIETLLPTLAATGRLHWMLNSDEPPADVEGLGPPLAWSDAAPWRLRLDLKHDSQRKLWELGGRLLRGEGESMSIETPVLMIAGGVMLLPTTLCRLEVWDDFPWVSLLRKSGGLKIPESGIGELLKKAHESGRTPPIDWPEELRCTRVAAAPIGKLRVKKTKESWRPGGLSGFLAFDYGSREVGRDPKPAVLFDAERRTVIPRDLAAERHLAERLRELGLKQAHASFAEAEHFEIHPARLPDVVDRLIREGWKIEAEGYKFRSLGEFKLKVSSGVDWFELDGEFHFDGKSAALPKLLDAVRKGERYVTLDDGSRGLLPEEWLRRLEQFAELSTAAKTGAAPRFRKNQATLLDALLAEQPALDVDKQFAAARRRVRSFQGVEPRKPPKSFQGTLRDYQQAGLGWFRFLEDFGFGGCLADDMGLGKTIQVLALLEERRTRKVDGPRAPSLVVAPKSLVFNWMDEAARFTPKLRMLNLTGIDRAARREELDACDVVLTTYGTLRRDIEHFKDVRFDYAVLDEAQAIKNADSQAAKACRLLQADHRLAMSGTPIENHLGELWSLFEFLNPGLLGRAAAFERLTKEGNAADRAIVARTVAPLMLRRTKDQVLKELPPKTEQTIYCELSKSERKQYDELRDYYRALLTDKIARDGLAKSKIHVLESLLRLRQAACHPGLLDAKRADDEGAKLDTLLDKLEEVVGEGHKALVFSQFTSLLDIVRRRLDGRKTPYQYLDGKTRDRKARVEAFQNDPACPLFLISLKAGGCGLNLTAADYVFILDPWWNPAVEAQAVDRAHRIGRTRPVMAYRLIASDTVEEKILQLQAEKRELAESIVRADENLLRRLTADDLKSLLG